MARRASLPGASELFRPTAGSPDVGPSIEEASPAEQAPKAKPRARKAPAPAAPASEVPQASGRVKHDHKITVYFSEDELNALEDANLELRRRHGIRVDRGRLVRTAVALALRDLAEGGEESALVTEFRG